MLTGRSCGGTAVMSTPSMRSLPLVGVAKPDPAIFDHALHMFEGIARERIRYVGDSVTMDIGGARAAGLAPILLDPYDDHPDADFRRIRSLLELVD